MDIYNGRYYFLNKTLLAVFGLWPYVGYRKKLIPRIVTSFLMVVTILPQILRIHFYFGVNMDKLIEHVAVILYMSLFFLKFLTSILSEKKLMTLYENIANNWKMIKDKHERSILNEYSERGRFLTIGYIIYMYSALFAYISFPLFTELILNAVKPNTSRPRSYIFDGDYYFIDRDKNYRTIYVLDCLCAVVAAFIIMAVDAMYASTVEHCLGLFAIIRFRLQKSTNQDLIMEQEKTEYFNLMKKDISYDYLIETIILHKKVLNFTGILESTYSSSFFFLVGINMLFMSVESFLVIVKLDQIIELTRFAFVLSGTTLHIFFISWPGQKLITSSTQLFRDAYLNEWYKISIKAQKLLGFIALRCARPCQLTAGQIYVMNFANFASVVKTSLSYMTLFTSLR